MLLFYGVARAENFIVQNGKPQAEIVVSDNPARMTKLAVREMQEYIKKISGTELPVVTAPGGAPVRIYVGKSKYTDDLGLDVDGLKYGASLPAAFRIRPLLVQVRRMIKENDSVCCGGMR